MGTKAPPLLHVLPRLTGIEVLERRPGSPQLPCDRAASPDRVPAAGAQTRQLDFAAPPEVITAQLLETQRQRVKVRFNSDRT